MRTVTEDDRRRVVQFTANHHVLFSCGLIGAFLVLERLPRHRVVGAALASIIQKTLPVHQRNDG